MSKVLISGYHGFGNIGDEAILEAMIDEFKANIPGIEICVLSKSPKETAEKFGVKCVNRSSVFQIFRAILSADILISGGGSLLQDKTSARSIHYYLAIIKTALLLRKRVILYAHGIGPIFNENNRRRTAKILNKVNMISLRDRHSKEDLVDMGVKAVPLLVSADPVFTMGVKNPEFGEQYIKRGDKPLIGISLRGLDLREQAVYDKWLSAVKTLSKSKQVILLPYHLKEDVVPLKRIKEALGDDVTLVDQPLNADQVLSIVNQLDLLVGMRLHSLIFAAVANVPMVAISYDPKIDYFMESIDEEALMTVQTLDETKLVEACEKVLENHHAFKIKLKSNVDELKKSLDININMIKNMI